MGSLKEHLNDMYTIFTFKSHPYRDRIIAKPGDTFRDYEIDESGDFELTGQYDGINFNPNDGVNAQVTLGKGKTSEDDNLKASYVLVTAYEKDDYVIKSRWFVMEQKKLRYGQWRMTLRRDIISDHFDNCEKSTFYIEKAMLEKDNALIYNSEGSVMNKVKVGEDLMTDKTEIAWIVGYYSKKASADNLKGNVNLNGIDQTGFISIGSTLETWEYGPSAFNASNPLVDEPYSERLQIKADRQSGLLRYIDYLTFGRIFSDDDGTFSPYETKSFFDPDNYLDVDESNWKNIASYGKSANSAVEALGGAGKMKDVFGNSYGFSANADVLKSYDGVSIVDASGKHYRCRLVKSSDKSVSIETKVDSVANAAAFEYLLNLTHSMSYDDGKAVFKNFPTKTDSSFLYGYSSHRYYLVFDEIKDYDSIFDMTGSKLVTEDSGYNIFAIPYPLWQDSIKMRVINTDDTSTAVGLTVNRKNSLALAQSIATQMGSVLYDIQLLPYCPFTEGVEWAVTPNRTRILSVNWNKISSKESLLVSYAGKSDNGSVDKDNLIGIILHCPYSEFSFDIDNSTMIYEDEYEPTSSKIKASNECDMYRLVSPNYQGSFEFTLSKNNFYVKNFHVDCKYKPYSPYIHVAPDFQGLYGTDYNDARGLTCSGDFSLDIVSDSWIQYQINNKNYENVFNRQIEYLDFNRGQERITQAFSIGVGTLQGATTGAMAGAMVGGPMGAVAGGIAGGASSAVGGMVDWAMAEDRYQQQRQYNADMYQYRLGNVQALPYTLTKISSFNPNSKIVPFIEKYSCTDVERKAFEEKIKYNSMSVGAIGLLSDYVKTERTFIKGQLIRYGGIDLDDHEAEELAKEFNMGVYI